MREWEENEKGMERKDKKKARQKKSNSKFAQNEKKR